MRPLVFVIGLAVLLSLASGCAAVPGTRSEAQTPTPALPTSAIADMTATQLRVTANPAVAAMPGMPFEIVAHGAAFVSAEPASVTLALRGDEPSRADLAHLPDEAQAALKTAVARPDRALYLVIYAGQQPSTGYTVRVLSITQYSEAGVDKLAVNYMLDKPSSGQGGATVMTYPYIVARVANTHVPPPDVTFVEQKSAP